MAEIVEDVARYYSAKLAEHGATPQGVDWNGAESQRIRFAQLARVIGREESFSINDLGCGYGALLDYLRPMYAAHSYQGIDVSADMIAAAREAHRIDPAAAFAVGDQPLAMADYGVASGIFNVRLDRPNDEWRRYIEYTLDALDRTSVRGFAFNCLTSYSDADRMRDYLFYADPLDLFDHCTRRYSRHVALLHDYGLYEFTMLVRKEL